MPPEIGYKVSICKHYSGIVHVCIIVILVNFRGVQVRIIPRLQNEHILLLTTWAHVYFWSKIMLKFFSIDIFPGIKGLKFNFP